MKEAMLRALGKYKYLTVSHILKLGISTSKDKTATYFRELQKDFGYVDRQIHYSTIKDPTNCLNLKRKRNEYLWHLTPKGAKFLDSYTDISLKDIRFPKRPREYLSNDYFHRVSTIFMHLAFDNWMQQSHYSNHKFLTYYNQDKTAKSRRFESETRLQFKDGKHFSPDAICSYTTPDNQPHIFVLEVYNSLGNNRINYVIQQLEKLFWTIDKTRKIEKRIDVNVVPRILCTLDNPKFLEGVLNRVQNNPFFWVEGIEDLLFFNLDRNVRGDFSGGWVNVECTEFRLSNLN